MLKMIVIFLALTGAIGLGITLFRQQTNLEKWELTKVFGFSILCSVLALGALTLFVLLF
jgi:hypothetical protein